MPFYYQHPKSLAHMYVAGRVVTLAFALIAVAAMWALAGRLYGAVAGTICALFLAVTPGFVYHAGFMSADVAMLAWMLLAMLCAVLAMQKRRMRWYIFAGIFVGLAAATRYQGAFAALAILAAHALAVEEYRIPLRRRIFDARLWLSGLAAIVVFCALDHYVFTRRGFLTELGNEFRSSRWLAVDRFDALLEFLKSGLGPVMAFFAIIGLAFMLIRNRFVARYREDFFLLFTYVPAAIFLIAGRPAMVRYLFPILPLAVISAGLIGAELLIAKPARRSGALLVLGVIVVAGVLAAGWAHCWSYAEMRAAPDVRTLAGEWIAKHVGKYESIGVLDDPWQFKTPPLDARYYRLIEIGQDAQRLGELAPDWFICSDYDLPPLAMRGPLEPQEEEFWRLLRGSGMYHEDARFERWPRFAEIRFGGRRAPHDMRYVNPRIFIYRRMWPPDSEVK